MNLKQDIICEIWKLSLRIVTVQSATGAVSVTTCQDPACETRLLFSIGKQKWKGTETQRSRLAKGSISTKRESS